jgi:UDP-2,3-diacylglucosamine hydrolase
MLYPLMRLQSPNASVSDGPIEPPPIGLLAGWGEYPFAVAQALRRRNHPVVGIGILEHADPRLAECCDSLDWVRLGAIGRAIRLFRKRGVRKAVMAGKIHKVLLYQPRWWLKHRPDWKCIQAFGSQLFWGTADRKDDTLLSTVVEAFARSGIELLPATDFAPELLVGPGHLAGRRLSGRQERDVRFGWEIAKAMGGLDIGQCVCVKDQTVLAVEAIEGTDACIRRAGELCTAGGFTLVKVAKPAQDMRFDVPTVGGQTLETLAKAGGSVLAIEAGNTILLDSPHFCDAARRLGVTVVAWAREASQLSAA